MKSSHSVLAVLALTGAALQSGAASAATCESLVGLSLPHTTIASATSVAASGAVPAYCLVEAHSHPTADSDIKILVALPASGWNGKYLQVGNGGFAGSVAPPTAAVQLGYVGAGTDDGHTGSAFDASWALGHPQKIIDFGYRALKETTNTAKAVTEAFFGMPPRFSYFQGCSDGGREALMEAQRFPEDWDGIVVGAPANFWTHLLSVTAWNFQALNNNPASSIPASKLPAIQAAALAQCDAKDGVVDGVVENPLQCGFDPSVLLCKGADSDSCLTAPQVRAVGKILDGARNPRTGALIFPGYNFNAVADPNPLGLGAWVFTTGFGLPQPIQFVFGDQFFKYMVFEDPTFDIWTLNFTSDIAFTDLKLARILNSTNPDLHVLKSRGARVLMWHGWEDGAISPYNSVNYYKRVIDTQRHDRGKGRGEGHNALRRTQDFFRLFMVPGTLHCGGGPGTNTFDALTPLVNWVEHGQAPERIIATKFVNDDPTAAVVRTRPLCPYPQIARYSGHGSTDVAANFVCADPDRRAHDDDDD